MICIGLDPGYEQSALVAWDGSRIKDQILWHRLEGNDALLDFLRSRARDGRTVLAIEKIESFGMAVGKTVFETVFQSGRFAEAWHPNRTERLSRREIKIHLCGQARATDSNIRQALIDRFGPSTEKAIGKKKTPGPLYGITSHKLAALAVALTWWDTHEAERDGKIVRPGIVGDF